MTTRQYWTGWLLFALVFLLTKCVDWYLIGKYLRKDG